MTGLLISLQLDNSLVVSLLAKMSLRVFALLAFFIKTLLKGFFIYVYYIQSQF